MAQQGTPLMRRNARGAVLGLVIITAVVAAIASLTVLQIAIHQARHAKFHHDRTRTRYAAEVGVVWAQQRLLNNPGYCGAPDPPVIDGMTVDVTVTNCGAGNAHAINATVVY